MKGDYNPSVVCALFCTQKGYKEFIDGVDNRKGMRVREIRLVDIGIPLDENFDDNLNFLKGGSMPILKRILDIKVPFGIKEKVLAKLGFKEFDYSKIWKHDNKNKMLYAGLTPLMVDDHFARVEKADFTDEEKDKCKRLHSFDTPDYKPKEIGVYDK